MNSQTTVLCLAKESYGFNKSSRPREREREEDYDTRVIGNVYSFKFY